MAIKVKSVELSRGKYVQRALAASVDYAAQAGAAAEDWAREAGTADALFFQAVSQPAVQRRFAAGVRKAGAGKYSRGITTKGAVRFGPGVSAGEADYASGVEPFLAATAALTLTARRPRGDPANYQRGQQVGTALHAKRIALLGGAT